MHLHAQDYGYLSIPDQEQFSQIEKPVHIPMKFYQVGFVFLATSHLIFRGNLVLGAVLLVSYSLSFLIFRKPELSYHLFWDPGYVFIRTAALCTLFFVNPCWLIRTLVQLPSLVSVLGILGGKLTSGGRI